MAKVRGAGAMIYSRSANFYTRKTREQLLRKEPDHSAFTEAEVAHIEKELKKWGDSKLATPPQGISAGSNSPPAALTGGYQYDYQVAVSGGYPNVKFTPVPDSTKAAQLREQGDEVGALMAENGGLPLGLRLNRNGAITGEPVVTGTFPVRIKATDALDYSTEISFTITVNDGTKQEASGTANADNTVDNDAANPLQ